MRETNSVSTHYSGEALTAGSRGDRSHQSRDFMSSVRQKRRYDAKRISFQPSALFPTASQAVHDEWKEQILHDVAPCLDLPAILIPKGFTVPEAREQALLEAIERLIMSAIQVVQDGLDYEAQGGVREPNESEGPTLTRRQIAVLEQLSLGRTPKEIARQLGVEVGTIRAHQRAAYARLGTSGRDAAVREARLRGLLFSQDPQ